MCIHASMRPSGTEILVRCCLLACLKMSMKGPSLAARDLSAVRRCWTDLYCGAMSLSSSPLGVAC